MRVDISQVDIIIEPDLPEEGVKLEQFASQTRSPYWIDVDSDGLRISEICIGCLDGEPQLRQQLKEFLEALLKNGQSEHAH